MTNEQKHIGEQPIGHYIRPLISFEDELIENIFIPFLFYLLGKEFQKVGKVVSFEQIGYEDFRIVQFLCKVVTWGRWGPLV